MNPPSPSPAGPARPAATAWWIVAALLAAATGLGLALERVLSLTSHAMLYVLAVVVASYTLPWVHSLAAAIGAVTLLNFFFVPPRFSFQVETQQNLVALAAMLSLALVISHLGTALRRETAAARLSEARARQLQALAAELADAQDREQVAQRVLAALRQAFTGPCSLALRDDDGRLALPPAEEARRDGMAACIREAATLGPGTGRWPGLDAWYLPLGRAGQVAGAACVDLASAADHAGREHAEALCTLGGQALWRLKLTGEMQAVQQRSQWHRVQSMFLAAISHDFRTPLASIVGAASSLQTQFDKLDAAERARLLAVIRSECGYLSTLTENTLQLVRLRNAGAIERDWQSLEEIVGAVLPRLRQREPQRRIAAHVPPGLPLLRADPVLLAQLLENLVDNALKYTDDAIDIGVAHEGDALLLTVDDRGPGLPADAAAGLFEPFARNDRSGRRGAGLGLAVCREIARAHGGSIEALARAGGGSRLLLRLPVEAAQPAAEAA